MQKPVWAGILLIVALGLTTYLLEAPEELEEATYLGLLFLANFGGADVVAARTQILVDNHDLQPPYAETDTAIEGSWQ
jgi:hypothetical protein